MNLLAAIAGVVVLLTCVGMVLIFIKKELQIKKRKISGRFLSLRHVIALLGIICNIVFGSSALALSLEPNPQLPHGMDVVLLLMTWPGYVFFLLYYDRARTLIKQLYKCTE